MVFYREKTLRPKYRTRNVETLHFSVIQYRVINLKSANINKPLSCAGVHTSAQKKLISLKRNVFMGVGTMSVRYKVWRGIVAARPVIFT